MELGYNTDIRVDTGVYHVQTEGRLDSNPRVETLVYRDGVVVQRVQNADALLGVDDQRIEETKRKIRDQHLSVVACVRRADWDRIPAVQPAPSAYDFVDLLPGHLVEGWKDVLMGRQEVLWDEWKRSLADACGLVTPTPRCEELREVLMAFASFLSDEEVTIDRKQALLMFLLRFDSRFKAIDFYEAYRRERGNVEAFTELIESFKRGTDRLVDLLVLQSTGESGLGTELLLELFTRQSMEMVKYLFEEAERKLNGEAGENREALPTVLLHLEDKVASENIPERELDDIFDRLSYLYARLSVKTVREVSARVAKIREERGAPMQLRSDQKKKAVEYVDFLDECKAEIDKTFDLERKLARIADFKRAIDGWDKVLRLYITIRLALKGYHNFVTVNLLDTSQLVSVRLRKGLRATAAGTHRDAEAILAELEACLDANMNVAKIVVPAIRAQRILASGRLGGTGAEPAAAPAEKVEAGAMTEKRSTSEMSRSALSPIDLRPASSVDPKLARVKLVEESIKISSLTILKSIDDLSRAAEELFELEQIEDLDASVRGKAAACRRELSSKKKVLQQRLSSL